MLKDIIAVTTVRQGSPLNLSEKIRSEVFLDTAKSLSILEIPCVAVFTDCDSCYIESTQRFSVIMMPQKSCGMGSIRREALHAGMTIFSTALHLLQSGKSYLYNTTAFTVVFFLFSAIIKYMKIPLTISLDKEGQYCFQCFSGQVKRIFKDGLTYYECLACGKISERSLVLDNKIIWWTDKKRQYWHESVGVVVRQEEKLLCLLRQIYPFAYTIPAGHLDVGEKPECAAMRELKEETGLSGNKLKLIGEFNLSDDSCRRGSDHHRWHLYRVNIESFMRLKLSDEASIAQWLSLPELRKLKNITHPLKYIVNTFGDSLIET